MEYLIASALESSVIVWFSFGLGAAFVLSLGLIALLLFYAEIDAGYLGLIFMLTTIFFLIGFSFLVAASTHGLDVKVAVGLIDGIILIGSKLLAPDFLKYLSS